MSWDFNAVDPVTNSVRGNWTSNGCMVVEMNNSTGEIKCSCNHLTNFAVLVVCCLYSINYSNSFMEIEVKCN